LEKKKEWSSNLPTMNFRPSVRHLAMMKTTLDAERHFADTANLCIITMMDARRVGPSLNLHNCRLNTGRGNEEDSLLFEQVNDTLHTLVTNARHQVHWRKCAQEIIGLLPRRQRKCGGHLSTRRPPRIPIPLAVFLRLAL
jgi:hypothetical protein